MTVPQPGSFRIPNPAQVMKRATIISSDAPAPVLGDKRDDEAYYWAETGVGIAFEHIGRLDLLQNHYAGQLWTVGDVHAEWAHKADEKRVAPSPYAARAERAAHEKWCRVVAACKRLSPAHGLEVGRRFDLPLGEVAEVDRLRQELVAMPEADEPLAPGDHWKHRGECATVRAALLRAKEHKAAHGVDATALPQVLLTNDGKAMKLAHRKGLASRTAAAVLREIVLAEEQGLDAGEAWALYLRMDEVASLPMDLRPRNAGYFAKKQ